MHTSTAEWENKLKTCFSPSSIYTLKYRDQKDVPAHLQVFLLQAVRRLGGEGGVLGGAQLAPSHVQTTGHVGKKKTCQYCHIFLVTTVQYTQHIERGPTSCYSPLSQKMKLCVSVSFHSSTSLLPPEKWNPV